MATIIEPPEDRYEPEYRHQFEARNPSGPHVVAQGSVHVPWEPSLGYLIRGNESDHVTEEYDVRLMVGPYWRDIEAVVPKVTIDAFYTTSPDQDDQLSWEIRNLQWDTLGEFGPSQDELRIRLRFEVTISGEHSRIPRLGYHIIARGRRLGEGGLNEPGPVKSQG